MKGNFSKILGIVAIVVATVLLWGFIDLLPIIGDPASPPNTHISSVYIEKGPEQTGSPNLVTGVLADYRGLDTMLETTVLYLASLTVTLIMTREKNVKGQRSSFERIREFGITEIKVIIPIIVPVLLIYALYVLVHGEISLGGGFQAGALIALAYILYSFTEEEGKERLRISHYGFTCIGAGGLLIYFLTGLIPVFCGGKFLEYGRLPIPFVPETERHSIGILSIEIGVTVTVAASIIMILEAILERKNIDDRA